MPKDEWQVTFVLSNEGGELTSVTETVLARAEEIAGNRAHVLLVEWLERSIACLYDGDNIAIKIEEKP